MNSKWVVVAVILIAVFLSFFVFPSSFDRGVDFINSKLRLSGTNFKIPHFFKVPPFRLGLDLVGGTHLVYQADLTGVSGSSGDAMSGVRDVIERRVNIFGVTEPLVQIEGKDRLIVELAGIKDVRQAIQMIGQTPFLEFKEERPAADAQTILTAQKAGKMLDQDAYFLSTDLTGSYLKRSQMTFNQTTYEPEVSLELNDEGAKLFEAITRKNLNKRLAIYIDGAPITAPTVQSVISSGKAVISGKFTVEEAKKLAINLNAGALPVPIKLISQQTIGASLGNDSLHRSLTAGLYGLLFVGLFMIFFYRLPGLISVVALLIYIAVVLAIYKLIPVTLTLAGIAGFVLSLGIAVDANVLIFARMREELKAGKSLAQSVHEGFHRAWLSIRDGHVTTLLGALVLYIFTTSVVKGFALTLGIGVLISLFTATVITRSILEIFIGPRSEQKRWLF